MKLNTLFLVAAMATTVSITASPIFFVTVSNHSDKNADIFFKKKEMGVNISGPYSVVIPAGGDLTEFGGRQFTTKAVAEIKTGKGKFVLGTHLANPSPNSIQLFKMVPGSAASFVGSVSNADAANGIFIIINPDETVSITPKKVAAR